MSEIQDEAYTELCAENEELRTLLRDFVRETEMHNSDNECQPCRHLRKKARVALGGEE
jgi:hypothetical protein